MAVLSEVWSGSRLAPLPKPADQYKKDKITQAVVIELSKERADKLLRTPHAGDTVEVKAKLSDYGPSIEFTTTSSDGKSTRDELSSKAFEKLIRLTENGYIYVAGETSGVALLRSRLDLKRLPSKKVDEGEDAGLLALQRGLHNAKAEKQSHRTTLTEVRPTSKRQGASLVASLTGGSNNPKAHRVGLFGVNKQTPRSLNASPSLAPQALGASTRPRKVSKKDAARKRAIVHLLAVRPVSASYIAKTIKAALKDVEPILGRIASPFRLDTSKYELNDLAYKLLDPYGFENYPEDDRSRAIERAIGAFDRKRFAPDNKAWQMLLPKDERNKGKCLSRLPNKLLSTDSQTQAPRPPEAARTTPVPEINVSEAGSPPRASNGRPSEASDSMRKRSSSDAINDASQERAAKRTKQGADPHSKVLSAMFNQTQKEKERAKERAKAEKEAQTLAKKRDAKPAGSAQHSAKAGSGKTVVSSRPAPAAAASSAPAGGKFKSAEIVSKSDDDEAEAEVQKGKEIQAAKLGKAAVKPITKTVAKTTVTAATSTIGTKTGTKAAGEAVEKAAKRPATTAAAAAAAQKPVKTSSGGAWDFSKKAAPAASSSTSALSSASATGRARASSSAKPAGGSRPPTPSSLGIHRRQMSDTRKTGVTSTTTKHGAQPPSQRPSMGASAAQAMAPGRSAAKSVEKPASARNDLIRKLDSAKRKPGMDPKASRPAGPGTDANAERGRPTSSANTIRNEKTGPGTSVNGKPASTGAPARASDNASAPPMNRTFSHQRKSSSPLKPSPLAASPPINLSDIDDTARQNRTSAAKTLPKKPLPSTEARGAAQSVKRKADELEGKHPQTGSAAHPSSGLERPVKRREIGTAASVSTGAAGSRSAAAHPGDASAPKPRRRSQEDGSKSHSPSPASSTIGSTSTKGTAMSLLSSAGKDKSAATSKPATTQNASAGKSEVTFQGIKTSELERLSRFEEHREQYNRKQREVAAMEHPPIEKVRELNKLFHSLETQKKVFAALENSS